MAPGTQFEIRNALEWVVLPFLYDFFADRRILTNTRWVKGLVLAVMVWIGVEAIVKPLAGLGFFSRFMPDPGLMAWISLACWAIYGLTLDAMTRVRMAHQLGMTERHAA